MFTWLLPFLMPLRDEGPGGSNGDDPADPPADDPDPSGDPDPADDPDDPSGSGGDDSDLDADALRAELRRVRQEAANRRVQARERERERDELRDQNRRILEALGITSDGDPEDPSAEAERLRTENRRLRTQNRFDAVAREAGADSDLTWGHLLARGEIDGLDPDAEDFETTLRERIDAALERKPNLAVTSTPPPPGPPDLDDPDPQPDDPSSMPMEEFIKWRKNRDQE